MRRIRQTTTALLITGVLGGAFAVPAPAASSVSAMACSASLDGLWSGANVAVEMHPSHARVPPGAVARMERGKLSTSVAAEYVPRLFGMGALDPGPNRLAGELWVRLRAAGSVEGTQNLHAPLTADVTVVAKDYGKTFVSSTPITVEASLPDSYWTAAANGATQTIFDIDALGPIEGVPGGAPLGSVFLRIPARGSGTLDLDCRPGTPDAARTGFTFRPALRFASFDIDPAAPPTGITRPGVPAPSEPPAPAPPAPAPVAPVKRAVPRFVPLIATRARLGTRATLGQIFGSVKFTGVVNGSRVNMRCLRGCKLNRSATITKRVRSLRVGSPVRVDRRSRLRITVSRAGRVARWVDYRIIRTRHSLVVRQTRTGCAHDFRGKRRSTCP